MPQPVSLARGLQPILSTDSILARRTAAAPSPRNNPSLSRSKGRHCVAERPRSDANPVKIKRLTMSAAQTRTDEHLPSEIICAPIARPTVDEAQAALLSKPLFGIP